MLCSKYNLQSERTLIETPCIFTFYLNSDIYIIFKFSYCHSLSSWFRLSVGLDRANLWFNRLLSFCLLLS